MRKDERKEKKRAPALDLPSGTTSTRTAPGQTTLGRRFTACHHQQQRQPQPTQAVPESRGLFNTNERQSSFRSISATILCNQSSATASRKTLRRQQRVTDHMTHRTAFRPTRHMTSLRTTSHMTIIRQHHVTSRSRLQRRHVQLHAVRQHMVMTSYPSRSSSSYCAPFWSGSEAYTVHTPCKPASKGAK